MTSHNVAVAARPSLQLASVLELLKPITWFPPMWAFGCGVISAGLPSAPQAGMVLAGAILAGPMVCGASQAVNDWYDRHVDAINEPHRPIPSGRIPGDWGLYIAIVWSLASLLLAASISVPVFLVAIVGIAFAWAYSAPPFRFKANGWTGNAVVGFCYEGLPWLTGAAVVANAMPGGRIVALAVLYSVGAHGIMTLNDFKAIEGDTRMGIASLPVQLGVMGAARFACLAMLVPQVAVVVCLIFWGLPIASIVVAALVLAQMALMRRFLKDPEAEALRFSAIGVSFYVLGMLASAIALGGSHP